MVTPASCWIPDSVQRNSGQVKPFRRASEVVSRVGAGDEAEGDERRSAIVDCLEQVEVVQDEEEALQDGDGKAQVEADPQHLARQAELALHRLVVTHTDYVDQDAAQRPAQQRRSQPIAHSFKPRAQRREAIHGSGPVSRLSSIQLVRLHPTPAQEFAELALPSHCRSPLG
jgi:hypothetical protein